MGVGDEELFDPVVFLGRRRLLAAAAALLRTVLGQGLGLHVTGMGQGDHHVLRRDQVFGAEVLRIDLDLRAAHVLVAFAVFIAGCDQFIADDLGHALRTSEDVEQVGDLRHHFLVLVDDLVLLEAGQALQAHLQDFLRLVVGQLVQAVALQAVVARQVLRTEGVDAAGVVGTGTGQHLAHQRRIPRARHQLGLRHRRGRRGLDDRDEVIDVGQSHGEAFQHMATLARLAELEYSAAGDHLATVRQEALQHLLQVQQLRLAVDQRDHVHAEGVLQLGLLVQIVEHDLGDFAALELEHHAHARFVGFVADIGNTVELLVAHQFGDALEQRLLVDLVGQLIDDDGRAAVADFFEVRLSAHHHTATAGAIAIAHTGHAIDDAGGREVRRRDDLDQLIDRALGCLQHMQRAIDHFGDVVRRDVGRHADCDAGRAVDQQVGDAGRQHRRLFFLAVIVGYEIDSFLVDVGQQFLRNLVEAALGVTHCRRVVAIDRAEVALTIDQRVAQRKILRHTNQRVVNRLVAVRVVFTHHFADYARALHIRAIPDIAGLVHRIQHATVNRLQAIPHIGQRTTNNDAHRVIEVALAHLLFEGNRDGFFCELIH